MGVPHAREGFERRAGIAVAVVVLLVVLCLVPTGAARAMTAARDAQLRSMSDAQLASRVATLDRQATEIGDRLLRADSTRDEIVREREVTQRLLGQFLAESYKQGIVGGDVLTQVLASGSIAEAADRARVADAVGGYHASLARSLDTAEANLDVTSVERARLITTLTRVQAEVVDLRAEQGRRDRIRAEHAATRAEQQAVADQARLERERATAAAAAAATGTLVSSAGSSSPYVAAAGPPSAAGIDAYLASKGSPMTGQGAAFMASGVRWQVDPRLLVAIAGAESSFGQVTCGPNNAWGWACPNDPADFATWAAGIDTVTRGLRSYYLDEGRTSVSLIQQKYCPVGAANDPTGLNSHWSQNVTKFLLEQGGNPAVVGPGPSAASTLQLPGFDLLATD